MKLSIKEASNDAIMLKEVTSDGSFYLIKSATRNKSYWNKEISYVNQFAKKESAIKKLYTVLQKLPDNAFYNEDDLFDLEDEDDLKNAKFAKFYITDINGKVIEDISDEVKNYLLSDDKFISSVLDDIDDEDLDESFIRENVDASAVKFTKDLRDQVRVGSIFFSKSGNSETYEVSDIMDGGRGSLFVTLKVIEDSADAKYSSVGRKIYSEPVSKLYGMMFIK